MTPDTSTQAVEARIAELREGTKRVGTDDHGTDLYGIEDADDQMWLAANLLSALVRERDEWRQKACDIGHDGHPVLWADRYSEANQEYRWELESRHRAEAALAEARTKALEEAAKVARQKRSEWLEIGDLKLAVSAAEEIEALISRASIRPLLPQSGGD